MAKRPDRYYFSFRSPYSWLAHIELTTRHPGPAAALEWIPFWEPDERTSADLLAAKAKFVYSPMSREKHFYILQDVRRLCAERGLVISWPVDRDPHWEVPHLAYLVAARHGRHAVFADAVYRARWIEGRDICDRSTMAAIAGDAGLDPGEVADAVDDPAVREEGLAALLKVDRDGVFGVPFFITGHHKFWGTDRLAAFLAGIGDQRPVPAPEPPAPEVTLTADHGHAGGCG